MPVRMPALALAPRYSLLVLSLISGNVFALDAAPTLDQANAALHLALDMEMTERESTSPLMEALQESMEITAMQGCQPIDTAQTTCIVKIEMPMRDGYQPFRFRQDGASWRLVKQADIAAPQPSLARTQELVREHLVGLGSQETDAKRAAEYREFAASLDMTALESCDLDRDSGAVECHGEFHTPGAGQGSKPMRFELRGSTWSLLPD